MCQLFVGEPPLNGINLVRALSPLRSFAFPDLGMKGERHGISITKEGERGDSLRDRKGKEDMGREGREKSSLLAVQNSRKKPVSTYALRCINPLFCKAEVPKGQIVNEAKREGKVRVWKRRGNQ